MELFTKITQQSFCIMRVLRCIIHSVIYTLYWIFGLSIRLRSSGQHLEHWIDILQAVIHATMVSLDESKVSVEAAFLSNITSGSVCSY